MDGPARDPPDGDVIMRLRFAPGTPMTGTLAVEGTVEAEAEETTFCGWIELMSAIGVARSRVVGDPPPDR